MITQPSDIVSLAHTRPTDQTEEGAALVIGQSVVDKAIKVSVDDGYIAIECSVEILIGDDIIDAGLAIHKVLVCLDQWTFDNQLWRDKQRGQMIKVRYGQSNDQSIPLGGSIVKLDDI